MASLEEKTAFFNQLKPSLSDDDFDAYENSERQRCRGFFKHKSSPAPPFREYKETAAANPTMEAAHHKPRITPRRVVSAPMQSYENASTQIIKGTPMATLARKGRLGTLMNTDSPEVIIVDDTPIPETAKPVPRGVQRSNTTPLPPSKRLLGMLGDSPSPSVAMKKRRRDPALKLRPEEEQIFRGLTFYYIPDNDIAPARRIRIGKAREYGATWTRTAFTATHIVVEKNIDFKDIGSVLEKSNKVAPPRVVNEDYPIDCIQFKALLQHNQKKYQLTGQPMVEEAETSIVALSSSEESSVQSLQLKPPPNNPRRWDYIPPAGTPMRSEESSQRSRVTGTPVLIDSQPVILDLDLVAASQEEDSDDDEGMAGDVTINTESADKIPRTDQTAHVSEEKALGGSGPFREEPRQDHAQNDELSEYINIVQEYKDLPLDEEEDDGHSIVDLTGSFSDFDDGSGSEDERIQRRKLAKRKPRGQKDLAFEDRFACNVAESKNARAGNPNSRIIEVLQQMSNYYDRVNDHWRTTAYRKAITTLKRQDTKVTTEEEAFRLPNIGQRLAQKIEEIATTNKLQRLEYAQGEPMTDSLQLFLGIYGVGNFQAQQWISQGFRTLGDLKEKAKLTPNQLVGVEHYDDLNSRISRREVEALGAVVQKAGERIDPDVELIIGGSYRRGAETSGDIDFIVTKPNTSSSGELRPFLDGLVQRLEAEQFLVARLASSRSANDGSKWHGCCILPKMKGFDEENYRPTWRRVDFLLVPEAEMGAALIYFTGNDIFNRSIRLLASKKGMRLNQRGLYKDVIRGPARAKLTEGELVEGRDERRIFEILGVKWREPTERWC